MLLAACPDGFGIRRSEACKCYTPHLQWSHDEDGATVRALRRRRASCCSLGRSDVLHLVPRCRAPCGEEACDSAGADVSRQVGTSSRRQASTDDDRPSSTDARTSSTYRNAAESLAGVGLGFVLSDVDDVVCIDLDHCLNPLTGRLAPWAAASVRDAGATYVKVSPSGDGLHIWGRADVRQGRRIRRPDGTAVEIYGTGRYIAVTGRRHGDTPSVLGDVAGLVGRLLLWVGLTGSLRLASSAFLVSATVSRTQPPRTLALPLLEQFFTVERILRPHSPNQ